MKKVQIKLTHKELTAVTADLSKELIIQAADPLLNTFCRRLAISVLVKWNNKMIGRVQFHKKEYNITLSYQIAAAIMIFYPALPAPITSLLGNTIHTIKNEIDRQLC